MVTINLLIVFRLVQALQCGAMEKFVVIGISNEEKRTVKLSLPIAKHYEPHIVNKCEKQVYPYPLDIIDQAVNRKKFEPTHIKPLVLKEKMYLELPLTLHQILDKHPYPLAQGPVLLAPNFQTEERWSVSKVLNERTIFSHDVTQDCYDIHVTCVVLNFVLTDFC